MDHGLPSMTFSNYDSNSHYLHSSDSHPATMHNPLQQQFDSPTSERPFLGFTDLTDTGPRQSRKLQLAEANDAKSSASTYDPKALLNPRGAAGRPTKADENTNELELANGHDFSADGAAEDGEEGPGMSSMIERVHRVRKREMQPQKKRKLEEDNEDDEKKHQKSTYAGSGKGGIIGDYMKTERDKGASEIGPPIDSIDLTLEDDDDVVCVGSTATEEICLGMLSARVQAFKVPANSKAALGQWWPLGKINIRRVPGSDFVISVLDVLGTNFGRLDPRIAGALCPLLDGGHVSKLRLKTFLMQRPRDPQEQVGMNISKSMDARIVLYAPRERSAAIGRLLSRKQLFLNAPFHVDRGISIENPQLPKDYNRQQSGAAIITEGPNASRPGQSLSFNIRSAEQMREETFNMFNDLTKTEDLPEMEAGDCVQTELLVHQKQGLHFLVEHEKTEYDFVEDSPRFSLWKPQIKPNGQRVWYNVITGHEVTEKPEPVCGGILADMMGLGKTLSILALICHTIDHSRAFGLSDLSRELFDSGKIVRNTKSTLIVCPKSVMSNWDEQIRLHVQPGRLKHISYHGSNRTQDLALLAKYDVVITSYNIVAAEFSDANRKRRALTSMQWFRVVLDEAHGIRTQSTQVSKGCCSLLAQRRWAVTGTPVQNRLEDLGALIKFLRVKPFDTAGEFSRYFISPFKNGNTDALQHLRLLVDGITLRRMKDRINLPERVEKIVRLTFTDNERSVYDLHARYSQTQVKAMMGSNGIRGKGYSHVLASIGRLRVICAHNTEMLSDEDMAITEGMTQATAIEIGANEDEDIFSRSPISENQAYDMFHMLQDSDMDRCNRCMKRIGRQDEEEVEDEIDSDEDKDDCIGHMTPCFHIICPNCINGYKDAVSHSGVTEDNMVSCPMCEIYVRATYFELKQSRVDEIAHDRANAHKDPKKTRYAGRYTGPSTKVKALIHSLQQSMAWSNAHPDESPERSVVFSGWTTYLDLIEIALIDAGIGFVRLDGTMSVKARTAVLTQFRTNPDVHVIIVSIKAGGQGLNFTAANRVYMMEPQFNPGVEQQAIDRVHRLGQAREVQIVHYIMHDSFEEKVLLLQEKKNKLAKLSLERKMTRKEEAAKKMEELRDLFK